MASDCEVNQKRLFVHCESRRQECESLIAAMRKGMSGCTTCCSVCWLEHVVQHLKCVSSITRGSDLLLRVACLLQAGGSCGELVGS